jgi:O-antigen/teichoic acid export membrane protein
MERLAAPPPSFQSRLAAVLAGELVNKTCVILAFIWVARTLDPSVYGDVEWSLSILFVSTLIADAGLATWAVAEVAAKPGDAGPLVARIGWLRFTLAVPAYLLMMGAGWSRGETVTAALAVYGAILFLTPLFLQYLFNGLFQPYWAAIGNALRGLTFAVAVLVLVRPDSSPVAVAVAELLGAAALACFNLVVLRRVFRVRVPIWEGPRRLGGLFGQSWAIGASEVVWGVQWYAGLVLLGYLASSQDAAWHSVGLRMVMALHTGVWLYLSVLLPTLARLLASDRAEWRKTVERSVRITSWAGLAVGLVGTLGAETILRTAFGAPFADARPALQAVVWVIPVAWLSGHIRYSLIAAGHPRRDYVAAIAGTVATVTLTWLLVPWFGSLGAALGLLGGMLANGLAAWTLARSVLPSCAYVRSTVRGAVVALALLSLGLLLVPVSGEVIATVLAGATFASVALYAERDAARAVIQSLIGTTRVKVDPNADASA